MRTFISLAATAALASAGVTIIEETNNECWFGEGAEYLGECFDLFYWYCDEYNILPDSKCVIRTFSDSLTKAESKYLDAAYWNYAAVTSWMEAINAIDAAVEDEESSFDSFKADVSFAEQTATRFQDDLETTEEEPTASYTVVVNERPADWVDPFEEGCYELNTRPISMDMDAPPKLNFVGGFCGFKIQFTNTHEYAKMPVRVLRDGASTLAASAAVLLASAALF